MFTQWRRAALAAALVTALSPLFGTIRLAEAHERRDVAKYEFVVGWTGEPAFEAQKNGIDLRISVKATGEPVAGAEQTLKVEVIFGAERKELRLRGVFQAPGRYTADLVPTREGNYRFRFFGAIEGVEVNETFDSADKKFHGVESLRAIQFPAAAAPPAQVAAAVPVSAIAAQPAPGAQAAMENAQIMGMAGAAAGGLALVVSLVALARNRPAAARKRPAQR